MRVISDAWLPALKLHLQEELDRDTDSLKKEITETRLLAQKDIVLDPDAEMPEVPKPAC